jgi:hypothetical protein
MDKLSIESGFRLAFDEVYQGWNQILRLAASRTDENSIACVDVTKSLPQLRTYLAKPSLDPPSAFRSSFLLSVYWAERSAKRETAIPEEDLSLLNSQSSKANCCFLNPACKLSISSRQ